MKEKIFHAFQWDLTSVTDNLENIKRNNFTAVQINPIQRLKEDVKDPWWMLYQSCGFKTIGNVYGTEEELKELCTKANKLGIKIIVDIVINHVCGDEDGNLIPFDGIDKSLKKPEFYKEFKEIGDWYNREEIINYSMHGLPSLRLDNKKLQNIIFSFLNKLVNIGVKGFRIDSCKQIRLPREGSTFFNRLARFKKKHDLFIYGEIIFEPDELIDEYLEYIDILTSGYCGCNKNKTVTFFMSHDSEKEFGYSKSIDDNDILNCWERLVKGNKESNVLFYPRAFKDHIWNCDRMSSINVL